MHYKAWAAGLGQMYLVLFSVQDYCVKTKKARKTSTLKINVTVVTVIQNFPLQHY